MARDGTATGQLKVEGSFSYRRTGSCPVTPLIPPLVDCVLSGLGPVEIRFESAKQKV